MNEPLLVADSLRKCTVNKPLLPIFLSTLEAFPVLFFFRILARSLRSLLVELVQSGQLIGLALQTAVFLLLGLALFNHSLQRVRKAGELGAY